MNIFGRQFLFFLYVKQYKSGDDPQCAGMLQHDENVGQLLKKIDDMGIANNTIVIYSTDNGPEHQMTCPPKSSPGEM